MLPGDHLHWNQSAVRFPVWGADLPGDNVECPQGGGQCAGYSGSLLWVCGPEKEGVWTPEPEAP